MVILYEKYGALSNNLFQHIHFDSFCRENKVEFVNNFISGYCEKPLSYTPASHFRFKYKALFTGLRLAPLISFDNENENVSDKEQVMRTKKTVFVKGWAYRNMKLTTRERNYYRDLFFKDFNFDPRSMLAADKPNIAIHIRRGDYKTWQNGRFYYNDDIYVKAIDRILKLLKTDAKILIFSNDKELNTELYLDRYKDCYISTNKEKVDHFLMSQCNYIIGPPSSFSMWASYIGNTKFFHIGSKDEIMELENFAVCNG
jgi:hypothetical protein